MNKKEIKQIIKEEVKRLENIGCEVTNVKIEENVVKFYVNDYNNDCGNFHQIRKMFLKKHQPQKRKPQSDELCPHCGNRIERKHKFCPQCGQKLEKKEKPQNGIKLCPHCGNKIGENNKFCPHCGQKII